MNPDRKQDIQEQLVEYFLCVDDDRAQIELCCQYVRLGWTTRLLRLLSSVRTWRIIESNSSLYFDELASALTSEHWDELIIGWKEHLNRQPETYSEQDIFSVYTVLKYGQKLGTRREPNRLSIPGRIIDILKQKTILTNW